MLRKRRPWLAKPIPILLILACLCGCDRRKSPENTVRLPVRAVLDSMHAALLDGEPRLQLKRYADSSLQRYAPLSAAERLLKYEYDYLHHTTHGRNDFENGNRVVDSALHLFDHVRFRETNQGAYINWMLYKGDMLVGLKRLNEAFFYYYSVRENYLEKGDTCNLSQFTHRLGNVRYMQRNYRDAIEQFRQSYAEYRTCAKTRAPRAYYDAVTEPQSLLNGIAWFYDLLGEADSAFRYYHLALDFLDEHAPRFPERARATEVAQGVIYGNLGGLYAKTGRYDEAERYLRASLTINRRPRNDNRDAQSAQIKLADLYVKQGRFDAAAQQLAECRQGLDTLHSEDFERRWRHVNWQLRDKADSPVAAYSALKHYHHYQDSLSQVNQTMMGSDFQHEFNTMEQRLAYAQLAYRNRLNSISLAISVFALILVSCIVYLVYANWQRSKRNLAHLTSLNARIQQQNEKLYGALLALHDSQQDNTRILAMVAHDLHTPIANIMMSTDYLLQDTSMLSPDQATYFEIIQKSNGKALELIGDLMRSYENDVGSANEIALHAMVQDCADLMRVRTDKKQQELVVETEPLTVTGSSERLWRVISNLIDNAIKFTPRGGRIAVYLRREADEAVIEVEDNGMGIEAGQHGFFEMGNPAGRTGTEGEPSSGLGLAIVKQIVSAHRGRIHFTSAPGKGSTFYVRLPL